jgi:hypothetical protein
MRIVMTTGERQEPPAQAGGGSRAVAWARANSLLVGALAAGLVARIVFWAMTDRRIDDALITIKHDKNLVDGVGLVHHLGEGHVHGFTSALSVLVPLPGELIAEDGGFFMIRVVSLLAFVAAAVYAYRICRELDLGPWPTGFALAYLALDQNQIFFGMAGMETQIAVGVLLAGIYYVMVEDHTKSGIALGLAILARPDFVLWVLPAYAFLLARSRRGAARAGLWTAGVVAPWLIFTTAYYGSPIPHTITAKSAFFGPDFPALTDPGGWISFIGDSLSAASHDWTLISPFLERLFVIATPLPYTLLKLIAFTVAALALIGAFATWRRVSWRPAIAFAALFVLYKVFVIGGGYNEWYGPPAIAVIFLLAAAGLDRITRSRPAWLVAVPATVLALAFAIHIPFTFPLERTVQHQIEDQVRLPMGRYLGEVVKPGQTIGSESAGYVSYYTNATLYDFPGLTSPAVVEALQSDSPHLPGIYGIAELLRPDFLIMRPTELQSLIDADPQTADMYRVLRTFEVPVEDSRLEHWGLDLFNVDREFTVLELKPSATEPGSP